MHNIQHQIITILGVLESTSHENRKNQFDVPHAYSVNALHNGKCYCFTVVTVDFFGTDADVGLEVVSYHQMIRLFPEHVWIESS